MRHRKTREACFRLRTESRSALIADLPARAGRRTRKRRYGGRVIVRLHFHQYVDRLLDELVLAIVRTAHQASAVPSFDHRRIIGVRRQHAFGCFLRRGLDHAEQALVLLFAVDHPARVEDLVPAVLRIGLGKHHEFSVRRVSIEIAVATQEVVDFFGGQSESKIRIGGDERLPAFRGERHYRHGCRFIGLKQSFRFLDAVKHRFRHSIAQQVAQVYSRVVSDPGGKLQRVADAALYTLDGVDIAGFGDVGRFARPGRNRTGAGNDVEPPGGSAELAGFVPRQQQRIESRPVLFAESGAGIHQVDETRFNRIQAFIRTVQNTRQLGQAEIGQCGLSGQFQHVGRCDLIRG